jgi:hypothetical protein
MQPNKSNPQNNSAHQRQAPRKPTRTPAYYVGHVIHDQCHFGVAIVERCQGVIALLSGSIPDFQTQCLAILQLQRLTGECRANSGLATFVELDRKSEGRDTHRRLAMRRRRNKRTQASVQKPIHHSTIQKPTTSRTYRKTRLYVESARKRAHTREDREKTRTHTRK